MADPVANEALELIEVDKIIISERLRPVELKAVEALAASVEEIGTLTDPIHVRRTKDGDELIDGAHRVALAMSLGWKHIKAMVWRCNRLQARLMEVDAGIAGAELNSLDLALFLGERKRIYEELHPETKRGVLAANARWEDANATMAVAFTEQVAQSREISVRNVQRLVRIGAVLKQVDADALRNMETGVKLKDLEELSKIADDKLRGKVINTLSRGEAKSARDAHAMHNKKARAPERPVSEKRLIALKKAWADAGKTVRKRWLQECGQDVADLLAEVAQEEDETSTQIIQLGRGRK